MKLASHNTFTYLKVRQWWMRPFAWMARCQRTDIGTQYISKVRMFDLRLRFHVKEPIVCHGLVEYELSEKQLYAIIDGLNAADGVYMRVVLETKKADKIQDTAFYFFCKHLEEKYPNIRFFGGNNRADWECKNPIYRFDTAIPDIEHRYSSTMRPFFDDLWPWIYARLHNRKNIEKGTDKEWMMIDFVDIR